MIWGFASRAGDKPIVVVVAFQDNLVIIKVASCLELFATLMDPQFPLLKRLVTGRA
jgi:hypothetical protein